jgi:CRISPR type III-A-associated RAMP protein Csm4
MNLQLVRLRFRQPLHLSRGKLGTYESSDHILHSDTVQASLFVCALQLYDESTALDFQQKVAISSAFPFDEHGEWLPRPLNLRLDENPDTRKDLKKIRFFKKVHFEKVLRGEKLEAQELLDQKGSAVQPKIWQDDMTQRVLIDRLNASSVPFYLEKLYPKNWHADRGLYVLIKNDGFDQQKLKSLFRLLGDNGIGLQRNLGNGTFDIENLEIEEFKFDRELPATASAWVNLSLYRPDKEKKEVEKIKLEQSHYQLLKRGGWLSSPEKTGHMRLRKKSVLMFSEGSVLAFGDGVEGGFVRGKIEETQPREDVLHPVFRDGRGIFLPMK